ncbi:hypothetical protein D3C72_2531220 [compost metagenome]
MPQWLLDDHAGVTTIHLGLAQLFGDGLEQVRGHGEVKGADDVGIVAQGFL